MFFTERLGRIASRAAAGLVAVAALASCGGGTYQVQAFVPARILTFGDENSMLIGPQGLKYSINGVSLQTDLIDCTLNPMWTQLLAASYSLVYGQCNPDAVASPGAISFATVNATVDDATTQVAAFLAGDTFNANDMVTIWVGEHDVLNQYLENGVGDQASLIAGMRERGAALANLVNSIAATGAKTILLTIPPMSDSPFAATENERGDFDRATLLGEMSDAFNRSMRSNVVNDGSKIGLVLVDDYVQSAIRNPGGYGLISSPNVTTACQVTVPLPDCRDDTLVTDPVLNSNDPKIYLWADATHLGPSAHTQIGNQAVSRAHSNPF